MAVAPVSPVTFTGPEIVVGVPFPSWPLPFQPQAQTVPSFFNAYALQ